VVLLPAAGAPDRCAALDEATKLRLAGYVHKRYGLPPGVDVKSSEVSVAPDTCVRRLRFKSTSGAYRFNVALCMSPDQRFLAPELLDSLADPAAEELKRSEALRSELLRGSFAVAGPARAPVTIVVFSDFQCPFCARLAEVLRSKVLPVEGGGVRLAFRHFPIATHPWARLAAEAAACAHIQSDEAFWSLHDFIFAHQQDLTSQTLLSTLGSQVPRLPGIDKARYDSCVLQRASSGEVADDIDLADALGVESTPTFFVNGHKVEGFANPEQITSLIKQAIRMHDGAGQTAGHRTQPNAPDPSGASRPP